MIAGIRRGMAGALLAVAAMSASEAAAQGGDGYLFREPTVSLKFETGYGFQRAESDLFDFVITEQTIDRRDFDSPYVGGELALRLSEHADLAASFGYQSSTIDSEYRDFIGTDDLPIRQVTEFRQVPVIGTLKLYPFARGRSLGRFAWVPRTITPYVGGGAGGISYRFEQYGEFVDEETLEIFEDAYVTHDWGFAARALGGVNISLGNQFVFSIEGRYTWASADVSGGYAGPGEPDGFDRIDLDGLQVVGGLAIRF